MQVVTIQFAPGYITSFGHDVDSDAFELGFEYVVDGRSYRNETSRDPRDYPASQIEGRDPNEMTIGTQVAVYYNPDDPADARLVPGVLVDDWMFLMATPLLVFLIVVTWKFGLWMFEILCRLRRRQSTQNNSLNSGG